MAEVQVKAAHIVKPTEKTWTGKIPLSKIDKRHADGFLPFLYFYRRNELWTAAKVGDTLKASLAKALVQFYPYAGRIRVLEGGEVVLECEEVDMWVPLVEAEETSGVHLADLGGDPTGALLATDERFKKLLPVVDRSKPGREVPLVAVQVTYFRCGGLGLGLVLSHGVGDGAVMGHFLTEWCRLARGEPLEVAPVNDRTLLGARGPSRSAPLTIQDLDGQTHQPPPQIARDGPSKPPVTPPPTTTGGKPFPMLPPPFGGKTTTLKLVLSKSQFDKLKEAAGGEANGGRPFSRYEVLTAHIWRCLGMTRAGHEGGELNILGITIDIRKRMNPPLPKTYFGNAIVMIPAISEYADEITSSSLGQICGKIRQAIDSATEEYVRTYMDQIESQEGLGVKPDPILVPKSGQFVKPNFAVLSWLTMPVYDLDFGWGKEMAMGSLTPPTVMVARRAPGLEEGSAMLIASLEVSDAEKFKKHFYRDLV